MRNKIRVAIVSHFGGFQSSYALHVGWHERARLLERFGVDFDFLVNNKCKEGLYPNQKNVLPSPPSGKPFDERVAIFYKTYTDLLKDYNVILTADMVYQRKGNFLAYNAAMRAAAPNLKGWWCHWIHSGWTKPNPNLHYPENLVYQIPPRSFIVNLNSYELPQVAEMYGGEPWQVYPVYNPKDIRSFYEMDPLVWEITTRLDFPNKHIVDIFPFCSTRMDPKGIDAVINVMAAFKRLGANVALVLANANSRKRKDEIVAKKRYMESLGLVENEDYIWTSDLNNNKPMPRKAIADMFKLSNVFVFGSWRETVGNVFQEAKISGCHLILNRNLPCLMEMGGTSATYFEGTFKTPGIQDGQSGDTQVVSYNDINKYWEHIANQAKPHIRSLRDQWYFSLDHIWIDQMEPLLHRAYLASQGKDFMNVKQLDKWDGPIYTPRPFTAYGLNWQWGKDMAGAPLIPGIPKGA